MDVLLSVAVSAGVALVVSLFIWAPTTARMIALERRVSTLRQDVVSLESSLMTERAARRAFLGRTPEERARPHVKIADVLSLEEHRRRVDPAYDRHMTIGELFATEIENRRKAGYYDDKPA